MSITTFTLDLRPYADEQKVCSNPGKGWYVHYFDNGLHKYGSSLAADDYLEDFPGLDHIYLRLAWCYLEPEEGRFDWEMIDKEIRRWTERGYGMSFRVSCKETGADQCFATPRWVMEAGAQGTFFPCRSGGETWEPDYGDPIFLEKLEAFHRAFAERYDGEPWLRYVDIGSYGDWGEGHTAASSLKDWPIDVIKAHIDIHCKYYKRSQLVISDDIVGSRKVMDGTRELIFQYVLDQGITLRDDGISVKWFADRFGLSTLRNPEFFEPFWRTKPINMELDHYHDTITNDTWKEGVPLTAAVEESHATYVGFHGNPRQWLTENPKLARTLANRSGYWYFLQEAELPTQVKSGSAVELGLLWLNRGTAPSYRTFKLIVELQKEGETSHRIEAASSDNRDWMPDQAVREQAVWTVPEQLAEGRYALAVGLVDDSEGKSRPIELALSDRIRTATGLYYLGEIVIA
ncbi:DUF4832 domain-containing protein [Paenibacillus roseipurpureus]|uniref:DUF4832 domain-containing protein n=1 Tax=Paenibacillus roseopurpureus TaxID=2918901 RepID=A0AA96LLP8_9BACL|nr:DUF4832 domain-containing protein [Paenibacillus sp. MBLB1832]WNR42911.1 DUF4832 domain-containing protein [Paenibacillus sp. MBLB1832]